VAQRDGQAVFALRAKRAMSPGNSRPGDFYKIASARTLAAPGGAFSRREANYGVGLDPDHAIPLNEALTFDDVLLLRPFGSPAQRGRPENETHVHAQFERSDCVSAMDTVTEAKLAIALAEAGGIGSFIAISRPEAPRRFASQALRSGWSSIRSRFFRMKPLAEALALMSRHGISGIPWSSADGASSEGYADIDQRDVVSPPIPCSRSAN